jgi:hypothetical protein
MVRMEVRGGAWREEVWDRIGRMRDGLAVPDTRASAHVRDHLNRAEQYANDPWSVWAGRRGARIEAVWRELRLAEEALLRGAPDGPELIHRARAAHAAAVRRLGPGDRQVRDLATALQVQDPDTAKQQEVRSLAVEVLGRVHAASDADHRRLRALGGQLAAWIWGLAILAVALIVAVAALGWELLPPVAGGAVAGWQVIALAMVSGLVGAMFTAIPSTSLIPDRSAAFNPAWKQAGLKLVIGAWSGLVGMLAVTAGLAEAATESTTTAGFVMVAALFGAGQEAVTRFADRKASVVRDAGPGRLPGTP